MVTRSDVTSIVSKNPASPSCSQGGALTKHGRPLVHGVPTSGQADQDRRGDAGGGHDVAELIRSSTDGTEPSSSAPQVDPSASRATSSQSNAGSLITPVDGTRGMLRHGRPTSAAGSGLP